MYKLGVYIPALELEKVKTALFAAGAGRIGNYECCCWQSLGLGQFKPLKGSKPWLGSQGQLEMVEEYRVELVCEEVVIKKVIDALKASHPYEEPAFDVIRLEDF